MIYFVKSGARVLGTAVVTTLLFSVGLEAQHYLPEGTVTHSGHNVIVFADDPRPLDQAVSAIAEAYGWVIDYEDPVYSSSESRDATAPEWRREHPKERGLLIPSGASFRADLGRADSVKLHETDVLERVVMQYNRTRNPGIFRVIRVMGGRTAITGHSRQATQTDNTILDTEIQIRSQKETASLALQNLVSVCSSAGGIPINLGLLPINILDQVTLDEFAGKVACRVELSRILSKLPAPLTYQMLYDLSSRAYFLSIILAHQTVTGPDGKTILVPLKTATNP